MVTVTGWGVVPRYDAGCCFKLGFRPLYPKILPFKNPRNAHGCYQPTIRIGRVITLLLLTGGEAEADLSNEKRAPGWLGYIGDEKLPSYIGIIINHYKDPPTQIIQAEQGMFLICTIKRGSSMEVPYFSQLETTTSYKILHMVDFRYAMLGC